MWVEDERVFRRYRGIVMKQEEFARKYYELGLSRCRDLLREAMHRLQHGESVEEVMKKCMIQSLCLISGKREATVDTTQPQNDHAP